MRNKLLVLITLLFCILSCTQFDNPADERAYRVKKAKGDILIGAAAPWSDIQDMLWEGIEMAVDEINSQGGILGRRIRINRKDDEASVTKGQIIAQQFAEDKELVAVIGHLNSYVSVPVSIIYEYYGILMLSPMSTSPRLTTQGFRFVFRNIPNDNAIGKKLADFCKMQGYKNMVICHAKDDYGQGLANSFEMQAEQNGIAILDRLDYDSLSGPKNFRRILTYWKENFYFDSIFLAGVTPQVAHFIKEAREQGIMVPIVGGDGLDSPELLQIAGQNADNTFVAAVFNPETPDEKTMMFVNDFFSRYKTNPDTAAAQGYDAVYLLAYAMKTSGSIIPYKIAETIRSVENWRGVTGIYNFDENGDVDKDLSIKLVINGHFTYVINK